MTEDDARRVELVRAVELEDREEVLLTREDRHQADQRGRIAAAQATGRNSDHAFLVARADFAASRLRSRHSGLDRLFERSRWPRWPAIAVLIAALVAGVLANEFGNDKRMDLLAIPLLGTIGWNLLVYVLILFGATNRLLRKRTDGVDPLTAAFSRMSSGQPIEHGTAVERAAASFRARWSTVTAPTNAARAARTLHFGAALFAAGLIGGIYARALVIEYRAGWESTFLAPETVRAILAAVLGPASTFSGVAIPPLPEIAAMRWSGPSASGVNAGPWIHLYTLTIAGLVVVPRLILALWQAGRAARLSRGLPVAGRDDFYIRRLLRASGSSPGRARVTPYAYLPGEETRRRLASTLQAIMGSGAEVRFDEPVEYGAEDRWAATREVDPSDDYHLLLFTLSATPEAENHGEFAATVARKRASAKGTIVGALVDETPYRAHFAGDPALEQRIATRLDGWRKVLGASDMLPIGIDLSDLEGDALAKRIEANLIPDAEAER